MRWGSRETSSAGKRRWSDTLPLHTFRMISGRILLLALMNQLQTWRTERLAELARSNFSWSEGYALYRWSYSQCRRILTESFGRFPLRFRAEEDSLPSSPLRLLAFPGLFSGSKAFIFTDFLEETLLLRLSSCSFRCQSETGSISRCSMKEWWRFWWWWCQKMTRKTMMMKQSESFCFEEVDSLETKDHEKRR